MPCDGGGFIREGGGFSREYEQQAREDLDIATRLACMYCRAVTYSNGRTAIPGWAKDWWERHQEIDKVREAKEAALDKLTDKEKDLLGL